MSEASSFSEPSILGTKNTTTVEYISPEIETKESFFFQYPYGTCVVGALRNYPVECIPALGTSLQPNGSGMLPNASQ